MIEVFRGGAGVPSALAEGTFTGAAWRDVVVPDHEGFTVGNNFFSPGARTHWHSHPGGQLLIVIAGEGIVAGSDGAITVRAGDTIWTPPNVPHWHGATAGRYLLHTAVTVNGVHWNDAVSDEEFALAQGPC